jgi:hypothetical protein
MRSVNTLILGIFLAAAAPGLFGQSQPAPAAPAAPHKAARKSGGKPAGAKKAVEAPSAEPSGSDAAQASTDAEGKFARRDPFESLLSRQQAGSGKNLPPGKAGLQVSTLRLDGIVRAPNGMIAVVSNPQSRSYFLREGDQLYDGRVEKIAMDGVSFHEIGKDAFGKPIERQVSKRIYASAGEQQ